MDGLDEHLGWVSGAVGLLLGLVRKRGSMHSRGWGFNFALYRDLLPLKNVSRREALIKPTVSDSWTLPETLDLSTLWGIDRGLGGTRQNESKRNTNGKTAARCSCSRGG